MKCELGIEILYSKALCAHDAALVLNNGTHEDAYKNLPRYCQDLEAADPKTKALVERSQISTPFSLSQRMRSQIRILSSSSWSERNSFKIQIQRHFSSSDCY